MRRFRRKLGIDLPAHQIWNLSSVDAIIMPLRTKIIAGALAAGTILLSGCRKADTGNADSPADQVQPWFEEVSAEVGLTFRHVSGHKTRHWFPEIMSGGLCLLDYDNDGDLDVYFVQAGDLNDPAANKTGNQLFRNRGGGTFENVTEQAGVGDTGYGIGCACGDFDADGFVDLYVTNVGPNVLYRNKGDATFEDVTRRAGVAGDSWSTSAAFADYDEDGNLDLFVVNYVDWSKNKEIDCAAADGTRTFCSPLSYDARSTDTLYRNLGDGRFVDVSANSGIGRLKGNGLGIVAADLTGDGHLDFYVANDEMENRLWVNQNDGTFADQAFPMGCAVNEYGTPEASMGVQAFDVDSDGDLDLFLTHMDGQTNTLYVNRGGSFEDSTAASGLGTPSLALTDYGLGFADFDQDTHPDLFIAGGRMTWRLPQPVSDDPFAEPNQVYRGGPDGSLNELKPQGGTNTLLLASSRGAALGDLDNDGDVDLVINNIDAPANLLRNIAAHQGSWIGFRVLLANGTDALGATVRIESDATTQYRLVHPTYSYCTSNDPRIHFGLGRSAKVDRVTVHWLGGREETFGPFPAREYHEIRQGRGK